MYINYVKFVWNFTHIWPSIIINCRCWIHLPKFDFQLHLKKGSGRCRPMRHKAITFVWCTFAYALYTEVSSYNKSFVSNFSFKFFFFCELWFFLSYHHNNLNFCFVSCCSFVVLHCLALLHIDWNEINCTFYLIVIRFVMSIYCTPKLF